MKLVCTAFSNLERHLVLEKIRRFVQKIVENGNFYSENKML